MLVNVGEIEPVNLTVADDDLFRYGETMTLSASGAPSAIDHTFYVQDASGGWAGPYRFAHTVTPYTEWRETTFGYLDLTTGIRGHQPSESPGDVTLTLTDDESGFKDAACLTVVECGHPCQPGNTVWVEWDFGLSPCATGGESPDNVRDGFLNEFLVTCGYDNEGDDSPLRWRLPYQLQRCPGY